MILDELFFKLGVKADTSKLKDFAKKLNDVTKNGAGAAKEIDKTARSTQKLGSAAHRSGGRIVNIFKRIKNAALGVVGAVAGFAGGFFGLSQVADIEELIKSKERLYGITQKEVVQAGEYKKSMERTSSILQSLRVRVGLGLLPVLHRLVDTFNNLALQNDGRVVNGLTHLFKIIAKGVEYIMYFAEAADKVISSTIGWKNALLILAGIFAYVNRAMLLAFATNPITWVVAAIVGLILLIDDFLTFLDGGKSAFPEFWGGLIEWANKAWEIIKTIYDAWNDKSSSLSEKLLVIFGGVITLIKDLFMGALEFVLGLFDISFDGIAAWVDDVKAYFSSIQEAIVRPFREAFNWIENAYNKSIGAIIGKISTVGSYFGFNTPAPQQASPSVTNNTSVNASVSVSSPDPVLAGQKVVEELSNKRAIQNMQGGVAY